MPHPRFQLVRTVLRYAFHAAAALSALLLVACVILWPRSHYRPENLTYTSPNRKQVRA